MKLSVVIPAYNEEKYLPQTFAALKAALASIDDVELILVDNESTDATRVIAVANGARIVEESVHNIGHVRNTGAKEAVGDVIVFLDADTLVTAGVFDQIYKAMSDDNCLGGSAAVEYDAEFARTTVRFFMWLWASLAQFFTMRQGALLFCRADVFRELGGYDTTIYFAEDVEFGRRLDKLEKKSGRSTLLITEPRVRTSSRRWNQMGLIRMLFLTHPITMVLGCRVKSLWKDWYENAIR